MNLKKDCGIQKTLFKHVHYFFISNSLYNTIMENFRFKMNWNNKKPCYPKERTETIKLTPKRIKIIEINGYPY